MDAADVLAAAAAAPPAAIIAYGVSRHARATLRRTDGFATSGQVARVLSERAARRSGRQTRPGLSRPATHPAQAFGRLLGRTVRPEGGRRCYARWEDTVMVLAPPRGGKTALLGHYVIDAPGACVVTSTKVDILTLTQKLRAARGPVWLLNPEGMAGLPSTLRWSPIAGCADPGRAIVTAAYMVAGVDGGSGLADNSFWDGQNAKVLRSLLYAAAVAGASMWDLAAWITNPDAQEPLRILSDHPDTPPEWADTLRQVMSAPDRTRSAVYLTLQRVVEFMADPQVAAATIPDPHDTSPAFDLDAFVNDGTGTLYLLGSAKAHGGMGPLFAALTGLIFEAAKRRSQALPAGRLDPPLSLVLDEATNICPVPLPQWTSDAGGRGIALTYAIQSPSQLEARWGHAGKETVWQSSNCKLILGGLSVTKDLTDLSELLGYRDEITPIPFHPQAHRAAPQIRRVPVMTPAEIRQIPEHHAVVLYRSLRPVEIVMRPVWKRRDVRHAEKSGPVKSGPGNSAAEAGPPPALTEHPAGPAREPSVRLDKIVALPRRGAGDPCGPARPEGPPMSTDPDDEHPPVSLEELTAVVSALDEDLTALIARVAALRITPVPGPVPAPPGQQGAVERERAWWWPALNLEDTAEAAERLGTWVEHALLARHPHYGQMLRPCWWRHPGVVDELSALRAAWHGAYAGEGRDPNAAAEYLTRWLPAAMTRIEATFSRTTCTVAAGKDVHKDTDERYHRAQWTPAQVTEFLTAAPTSAAHTPDTM